MDPWHKIPENRKKGKRLSDEIGPGYRTFYRAAQQGVTTFKDMDYITPSLKFAIYHAENNEVYYEEKSDVIKALLSTEDVYAAHNPGEYFYSGPEKKATVIYTSKGYDFEGWEEGDPLNEVRSLVRHALSRILV